MYSDRIAASAAGDRKRSIKDRLGAVQNGLERQNYNKRFQGHDGKWQHDLYNDNGSSAVSRKDELENKQELRRKLREPEYRNTQSGNNKLNGAVDLRDKLSGPTTVPQSHSPPVSLTQKRASSLVKAVTPNVTTLPVSKASVAASNPKPSAAPKITSAGEPMNIASFLQSLGLNKYLITFQAEEIDMSVLRVMRDDELKELGIPMGPRKKITLALASQKSKQ